MRKNAAKSALYETTAICTRAILLAGMAFSAQPALANPQGANVVSGQATVSHPNSSEEVITQTTDKAIINWNSFNIGNGQTTRIIEPSSSSIQLDRVTSGGPTQILGHLTANGNVWIINQNGVFFGPNAQVNVAGLIASTADISDRNFRHRNYIFDKAGKNNAHIINEGTITVADSGLIALVAPSVRNDGVIQAKLGTIDIGSARTFSIDFYGDHLYGFTLDKPANNNSNSHDAAIANTGIISAQGGTINITARAARHVIDDAINNTGIISATAVHREGGTIVLDGGDGNVNISGTVSAGRKITIKAQTINVASNSGSHADIYAADGSVVLDASHNINIGSGNYSHAVITDSYGNIYLAAGDNITIGNRDTDGAFVNAGGDITLLSGNNLDILGACGCPGITAGGNVLALVGGNLLLRGAHITSENGDIVTDVAKNVTIGGSDSSINAAGTLLINNGGTFYSRDGGVLNAYALYFRQNGGSIQNAINAVGDVGHSGTTLLLGNETWNEDITIDKNNFTLAGSGESQINASHNGGAVITVDGNNRVIVENLIIYGNGYSHVTGVHLIDTSHSEIDDSYIAGFINGIELSDAHHTIVSGDTLEHNHIDLAAYDGSHGTLVYSTTFRNSGLGILLNGHGTDLQFGDDDSSMTHMGSLPGGGYFILQNGAMDGQVLDASQQTFDHVRAADFTQAQWQHAEDHKTIDSQDGISTGTVYYTDFKQTETPDSNPPSGNDPVGGLYSDDLPTPGSGIPDFSAMLSFLLKNDWPLFPETFFSYAGHTVVGGGIGGEQTYTGYNFTVDSTDLSLSDHKHDHDSWETITCANHYLEAGYSIRYSLAHCK